MKIKYHNNQSLREVKKQKIKLEYSSKITQKKDKLGKKSYHRQKLLTL